jgi:hypothetical protein
MSYSSTYLDSFTLVHAKHISSKVTADLKRIQRFYGSPSDLSITEYEKELIELLKGGYLEKVTYGFKRDGNWIEPTLQYTSKDLSVLSSTDDDPGRIKPNANIIGALFGSFLTYNSKWYSLSQSEQQSFHMSHPLQRGTASEPGMNGSLNRDKSYSAGGKALDRSTLINYGN